MSAKKKILTLISIIAITVLVAVGAFFFAKSQSEKARIYAEAEAQLYAGNNLQAIEVFQSISDYRDVRDRILECYYNEGVRLFTYGDYENAQIAFRQAQPYSDAYEQAVEAQYRFGISRTQSGQYDEAVSIFSSIMDYKDVTNLIRNDTYLRTAYYEYKFPAGRTIEFGRYRQTTNHQNIEDDIIPISWRILSNNGNELFLVSEYVLECMPFNNSKDDATWASCSLRAWLNDTFLTDAFGVEERNYIEYSNVENNGNSRRGTSGGGSTRDQVFCLSVEEIEEYLSDPGTWYSDYSYSFRYVASAFAEKVNKEYYNDQAFWWTRTPGDDLTGAVYVQPGGVIDYDGGSGDWVNKISLGVRPAIRLTLHPGLIK